MRSHILIDFDFGQIFITSTCFTINKKEMTMDYFSSNTLRIQIVDFSTFHSKTSLPYTSYLENQV